MIVIGRHYRYHYTTGDYAPACKDNCGKQVKVLRAADECYQCFEVETLDGYRFLADDNELHELSPEELGVSVFP